MKAYEIHNLLLQSALKCWGENTCDVLIVGDPNKEVHKIATCFKLTMEMVDKAVAEGVDMVITHEPTFSRDDPCTEYKYALDQQRLKKLQESGLTVYRYHDHAHDREPDYIHAGFWKTLGLNVKPLPLESFAVRRYELEEPLTVRELGLLIKERLNLEAIKMAGPEDTLVRTVCLALGWVGLKTIRAFADMDAELYITGETDEVFSLEYIRDANYFGAQKSAFLLGHYGAEYAGMRLLAEDLNKSVAPTVFLDSGEVFHFL